MRTLSLDAPAKLNLFLEVTGKRADGYHELATLFAKISLADSLHVCAQEAPQEAWTLDITGPLGGSLAADGQNLALRAARAFCAHFGLTLRGHIRLEKNIPMGAGLGGGSSDAAAVLRALCMLFDKNPLELVPTAARLGADVPLFLYPDTFLKGEGIGDRLTPVPAGGPLPWAVVVYPNEHVPTKGVFGRLRLPAASAVLTSKSNLDKLISDIRRGVPPSAWQPLLFNRLEEAVCPYVEPVRLVKEDFAAQGAQPLMSGSGSAVFALTPDENKAYDLAGRMQKLGRQVFVIRFGGTKDENN